MALGGSFDAYVRKARLAPVALACVPLLAVATAGALSPGTLLRAGTLAFVAVGVIACSAVRSRGLRLQPELWVSWGGSPTLQMVRHRSNPSQAASLHRHLSALIDEALPTAEDERRDAAVADAAYERALTQLREATRDDTRFRLVAAENAEYGMRRNMLGIRGFAAGIAAAALLISVAALVSSDGAFSHRLARWGPTIVIAVAALGLWLRRVDAAWVREAAELYARRLLDTLPTVAREFSARV